MLSLPRLYPILDAAVLLRAGIPIATFGRELRAAGIRFLQYRDKEGTDATVLAHAAMLRELFPAADSTLILNDRAALLEASGFDGLHIGQDDIAPSLARQIIGPEKMLGLSTHNADQLTAAAGQPVDYLAVGPIFGTQSKANPDPVIGLEGVRLARGLTTLPLVAIGGITLENAQPVMAAGADSVALISALVPSPASSAGKLLADFLLRIG